MAMVVSRGTTEGCVEPFQPPAVTGPINTEQMKRNYIMILACALTTGAMAQWQQVGLEGMSSTSGGVQLVDDAVYFHSAADQAVIFRSEDAGATWQTLHFADDGRSWKYNADKRIEYINFGEMGTAPHGLYRRMSLQDPWSDLGITVTDFDVFNDGRLIVSTGTTGEGSIMISDQHGEVWASASPTTADVHVRLVGRDGQGRPLVQTVPVTTADDLDIGLFRSSDQGDSWERINGIRYDLTGASSNADHSIICSNGLRLLKSMDDGEKWEISSVDFPYAGLTGSKLFNMGGGHVFFMCSEPDMTNGVNLYQSLDFGDSWSPVEEEISQHLIFNMVRDGSGHVFAATDNGVYRLDLASVGISNPGAAVNMYAYPVPSSDNVVVNAGGAMMAELRMYDASSREVLFVPNVDKPADMLNVGHLSPGIYILRAVTNKGIATTHVVVE